MGACCPRRALGVDEGSGWKGIPSVVEMVESVQRGLCPRGAHRQRPHPKTAELLVKMVLMGPGPAVTIER